MEITINYSEEQFYSEELETLILRVLSKGAELQNVAEDAELSLLICDADTIHELNKTYRGVDAPTDVLSFALNEGEEEDGMEEEKCWATSLLICTARLSRQKSSGTVKNEKWPIYLYTDFSIFLVMIIMIRRRRGKCGKGRRNTWCLRYGTYCNGRKT